MDRSTTARSTGSCIVLGSDKFSTYSDEYASGCSWPAVVHLPAPLLRLVTKAVSDRLLTHYKWLIMGLQGLENTRVGWQAAGNIEPDYDRNWSASSLGLKTPRSVMMPVINSAGVTSNAGL